MSSKPLSSYRKLKDKREQKENSHNESDSLKLIRSIINSSSANEEVILPKLQDNCKIEKHNELPLLEPNIFEDDYFEKKCPGIKFFHHFYPLNILPQKTLNLEDMI